MTVDVAVIGAGVSGLATACALRVRGLDVAVIERQVTTGGNAVSERFGGFLMEHGPSTMNAAYPEARAWTAALGLDARMRDLGAGVRKRYLRDERGLHGIAASPLGFLRSGYLSPAARLSLLAEIARPRRRGGGEESVHDFVARRFGRAFAEKVMEPMTAGIFMGESRDLSIDAAFPQLVGFERRHGSIIRGVLASRRGKEPGRRLFSWPEGVAELPRALSAALAGRVRTGVAVSAIKKGRGGFEIHASRHGVLHARAVVLAVQPHVAAALAETLEPETAAALGAIAAPPVAVAFFGFRRDQVAHPLDGLGYLATKSAGGLVTGAQFCSTMFPGRAPAGHVSISCYAGGARNPGVPAMEREAFLGAALDEISLLLGVKGDPVVARARHWPRGLPQLSLGHQARRDVIESSDGRCPGLFLTGNYLQGVSIANCLASAGRTAVRAARWLAAGAAVTPAARTAAARPPAEPRRRPE